MSTHVLEIAERICDRIGIINNGVLVSVGTVEEIRRQSGVEGSSLEELFLQITGDTDSEEVARFLDALG
jgi:ABC-2 type transport system ATP-binding protein